MRGLFQSRITKQFLVWLLLFSGVMTLSASLVQLYYQYMFDKAALGNRVQQVFLVHGRLLADAVWQNQARLIQLQLDSIIQIPGISAVSIAFEGYRFSAGEIDISSDVRRVTQPLSYHYQDQDMSVASLTVQADEVEIIERLKNQLLVLVLTQALRTFLVSAFVFSLIYWLMVRHLNGIVEQIGSMDANSLQPITLSRAPKTHSPDELDVVVGAINDLQCRLSVALAQLHQQNSLLEIKVSERTSELEKANRFKSEFLASVSHELRTPMNAIIGFSRRLLKQMDVNGDSREWKALQAINSNGHLLLSLINDILEMSRIEAGKLEAQMQWINVVDFLQAASDRVQPLAEEKGLTLSLTVSTSADTAWTDERILLRVFNNLVSNAIKYTPKGFIQVDVATGVDDDLGDVMVLAVTDTGMGIRPEDRARLFQEFSRAAEVRQMNIEGTGLGLVITARLVNLLGGRIDCESTYGSGSTFTVLFPQLQGGRS